MNGFNDLPDDEDDGEEGEGKASSSLVPPFGKASRRIVSGPIEKRHGFKPALPSVESGEQLYDEEMNGPPARVPDGYGRRLANGYTIVQWEDGFFYLYDEIGDLVEGERFSSEPVAEDRANELKPPGYRR